VVNKIIKKGIITLSELSGILLNSFIRNYKRISVMLVLYDTKRKVTMHKKCFD
jgi:hypothetical protein